jgi:hypothetical protein
VCFAVPSDCIQQIGGAVDDTRCVVETLGYVHHSQDFDDPHDRIRIRDGGDGPQTVDGADLSRFVTGFEIDLAANLAADFDLTERRDLTAREDEVAGAYRRIEGEELDISAGSKL